MNYIVRDREFKDIESIEFIVTNGWNNTYKGLVSDNVLLYIKEHELDRVEKRKSDFDINNNDYIVIEVDEKVVGFAKYGDADEEGYGELFALYILDEYQGHGFGKVLVDEVSKRLRMIGYDRMLIGCLVGTPNNEFYKHIGGKFKCNKTSVRLGEEMTDNVYEFII